MIGWYLFRERKLLGLSIEQVSKVLQWDSKILQVIECEEKEPTSEELALIMTALKLNPFV